MLQLCLCVQGLWSASNQADWDFATLNTHRGWQQPISARGQQLTAYLHQFRSVQQQLAIVAAEPELDTHVDDPELLQLLLNDLDLLEMQPSMLASSEADIQAI